MIDERETAIRADEIRTMGAILRHAHPLTKPSDEKPDREKPSKDDDGR